MQQNRLSRVGITAAVAMAAGLAFASAAAAQTAVGTITVCYFAPSCTYIQKLNPPVDAPAFRITNTSASPITHAVFTIKRNRNLEITKDRFMIGRIAPGKSVIIVPGYSDDGSTKHPPGAFFSHTGSPRDTSEDGPDADPTSFVFTGKMGTSTVSSGTIRAGRSAGPANDGTVDHLNFLGGPNDADPPCNDCFGPKQIGTLTIP